ncbi:MAG TPA: glycerol-3-phosphate dehydrogenase, partial [Ignavibacteria bacterium]|nr:glycerol-3-phosphate dehydrogenase [Ignavibacteria bacterium]
MRISVLGAGGWGTTLAILLHNNGHPVTLWEYKKDYAKTLDKKRENITYLPGIPIPNDLVITHNLNEAVTDNNMIVLAVPSQFLRSVIKKIDKNLLKNSILVSVSKGIENNTLMTMSQMLLDVVPALSENQIGVLSGPSHAEEVSRRIPTTVV